MSFLQLMREHLSDPEYVHVLINPMPVYGLTVAALALVVALFLRNQRVTIAALVLVFVSALSAWPTYHYGEAAYDRVRAISDPAGEQWLDEHMERGEKLIWAFYVLAGVSVVGVTTVAKWPRYSLAVSVATLVLASGTLGIGGYIAYPGGHVRHKEFRFEPPPAKLAEGSPHVHGAAHQHGTEQKATGSPSPQMEHVGHGQQPSGEQAMSEEDRKRLEASRLQLEASRMQLEASRNQLEAAGGASPSASASASAASSPTSTPQQQHQHDGHEHEP